MPTLKQFKIQAGVQRFDAGTLADMIEVETGKRPTVHVDHQHGVVNVYNNTKVALQAGDVEKVRAVMTNLPEYQEEIA